MVNKTGIKQYQQATRDRSQSKTEGGKITRSSAYFNPTALGEQITEARP